jgi:hypothetical protein
MKVHKIEVSSPDGRVKYTLRRRTFWGRLIHAPYVMIQHYRLLRYDNDRITSLVCAIDFARTLLKTGW